MRFHLIDRITGWESGRSLTGSKFLALGEEYLADHFPRFPVMPGVLMLQSVSEAAAWLWRATNNYRHSVIVLREAKQVKYGNFMQPGRRMDVAVEMTKCTDDTATFKGKGLDEAGQQTVSATLTLVGYNLASRGPAGVAADQKLLESLRARWSLLTGELRPQ
ncbi:MAG: hydroxymyristoyl-ACP dehydratase [Gemmataceae bacterium]